jgi:uncharacterized membrane protein YqjE
MDNEKSSAQQVLQGQPPVSWATALFDYLDLKGRLLTLESKEAVGHFVGILVIIGVTLVLALSSALTYSVFLLYLVALFLHLAWVWSALICRALLTIFSLGGSSCCDYSSRSRYFRRHSKIFQKDKEWLSQPKIKIT